MIESKKIFVSLPMKDRDVEAIKAKQQDILEKYVAKAYSGIHYELMNTTHEGLCPPDDNFLWYLGLSIQLLGEADIVIFSDDWKEANGCRIEYLACELYGIPHIFEGDLEFYDD